jgi:hypothetical protein
MKSKRTLSLALALLLLGGSLVSCATEADDPIDTDSQTTAVEEDENTLKDNLPDNLNYGGEEINFYSFYEEGMTSGQVDVPDLNGNAINDAVYERNKLVESRLNVKIVNEDDKSGDAYHVVNKTVTLVQSGSTDYDAITSPCWVVLDQSISGTFSNLTDSNYLDLSQPWWTQDFNEACSFQGNQYAASGHLLLGIYRSAYATVFNKAMFNDVSQPFLYKYVDDGTWTLDKQASLVTVFHTDSNGDGLQSPTDRYGLASGQIIYVDPYWASCGIDIIAKNADGEFELIFDSSKLHETVDDVLHLFYETEDSVYLEGDPAAIFAQGTAAMATIRIFSMEGAAMRGMEDAYGVVPMPRLSESQTSFRSTLHDGFSLVAAPATVHGDHLEMVCAVLEAMGSASYNIVRPAYYETTLRTKLASDPDSSRMMDIITQNLRTDPGYFYVRTFNSFHHVFRNIIASKQNTAISDYAKRAKSDKKQVKNVNTRFGRLAERNQ